MSAFSDAMEKRLNDVVGTNDEFESSLKYGDSINQDADRSGGLLGNIASDIGSLYDSIRNNVDYVESSPVGQWIGNNVDWLENSTPIGQATAPIRTLANTWPTLLALAVDSSVEPKDNDTMGGAFYNAAANGAANMTGGIADLLHMDGVGAAMQDIANKTNDDTPVDPSLSMDYITSPHGLIRSFGNAVGSMIPTLPSMFLAPEGLVASAARISPWLANGARYAMTAIPEAMSEGGQTRRQAMEEGLDNPDIRAWETTLKNIPLLAASNLVEGSILGGGLGKAFAGKAGESLLSRAAKMPLRATPSMVVEGLQNGLEEGLQQGIQNASTDEDYGVLPWNWTDDQWANAKEGFAGTLPLGFVGGARKAMIRSAASTDPTLNGQAQAQTAATNAAIQAQQAAADKMFNIEQDTSDEAPSAPQIHTDNGGKNASDSVDSAAAPFIGQTMDNGSNGCVEAVTKIGASTSPFLKQELSKGVVSVPTLVKDAGNMVVDYDPSNVEAGDIIVYGDDDHVVMADGDGGYVGNSSSQNKVIHGDNYKEMGGLEPTKIIKTGTQTDAQDDDGSTSSLTKSSGDKQIDSWIQQSADAHGVPANLLSSLLDVESGYQVDGPDSEAGAVGIAQFMPETAKAMGIDPKDPQQAIEGAARYLEEKYQKYGNWEEALEAYNGGDGNVGSGETKAYAEKVLNGAGDVSQNGKSTSSKIKVPDFQKIYEDASSNDKEIMDFFNQAADYIKDNSQNADTLALIDGMRDVRGRFENTPEHRREMMNKAAGEVLAYYNRITGGKDVQANDVAVPSTETNAEAGPVKPHHVEKAPKIEMQNGESAITKANIQEKQAIKNSENADENNENAVENFANAVSDNGSTEEGSNNAKPVVNARSENSIEAPEKSASYESQTDTQNVNEKPFKADVVDSASEKVKAMRVAINTPMKERVAQVKTMDANSRMQYGAKLIDTFESAGEAPKNTHFLSDLTNGVPKAIVTAENRIEGLVQIGKIGDNNIPSMPVFAQGAGIEAQKPSDKITQTFTSQKPAEQVERGKNIVRIANDNNITLPSGMEQMLEEGQGKAIHAAENILSQRGISTQDILPQNEEANHENETITATNPAAPREENPVHPNQNTGAAETRTADETQVNSNPHFDTSDWTRTDNGKVVPAAKNIEHADTDTFVKMRNIAKDNGGRWNRFAKRFFFPTPEARDNFVEQATKSIYPSQETPSAAQNTEANTNTSVKAQNASRGNLGNVEGASDNVRTQSAEGTFPTTREEGFKMEHDDSINADSRDDIPGYDPEDYHGFLDDKKPGNVKEITRVLQSSTTDALGMPVSMKRAMETLAKSPNTKSEKRSRFYYINGTRIPKAAVLYFDHLKANSFGDAQTDKPQNTANTNGENFKSNKAGRFGFFADQRSSGKAQSEISSIANTLEKPFSGKRYFTNGGYISYGQLAEYAATNFGEQSGRHIGGKYTIAGEEVPKAAYDYWKYLKGNKVGKPDSRIQVPTFAHGYSAYFSHLPLFSADEKDFVAKTDLNVAGGRTIDFGEITPEISRVAKEQSGADLKPGKIRLRVGNDKEGLIHAKKHELEAKADGYDSIEDMISDIAKGFDHIYAREADSPNGHVTYSLVKTGNKATGKMNGVSPVYFELQEDGHGGYYLVVTAIPKGGRNLKRAIKKERLIYSSPGLDAATQSNAGAVSHDGHNVGTVNRGGSPTSDKSSDSSTSSIPQEKKDGAENVKKDSDKDSIFGSIEDADRDMLDALGINPKDLSDEVLTAPDGIENTAEERARLEAEIRKELNKLSANPMFNPRLYTLGLKLAMTYVKDGINTTRKLIAKLEATFGDKISPWAPALAETVRTWPKGVPFKQSQVMAVSKAVGARYEHGITSLDDMQSSMKELLKSSHKTFAPMIEASYNGIKKFFDAREAAENGNARGQGEGKGSPAGRSGLEPESAEAAEEGGNRSAGVHGEESGERTDDGRADSGNLEREHSRRAEPTGVSAGTGVEETAGAGNRAGGAQRPVQLTEAQKKPSPEETPGHDFELKASRTKKTPAARFKQNVDAIKLLKKLEAEDRMPTPKEQAILGNYNGWGGLKEAFLPNTKQNKELRAILTPEEYKAAQSTINDAFYTPVNIIRAVWKGVSRLGFKGGRVLDPSMGVGNFFGGMPRDMLQNSSLRGIEIDDLTSRFAKQLYPSALIEHTGFEKASLADNFYDLVISNIPFGTKSVGNSGYKIHNYFFAHGMDKVRPGGLMVYITSQGSLASGSDAARMRDYLAGKADLVAAYKLPSGTFDDAGTKVGTDIVIFRKRGTNEMKPSYAQSFQNVVRMLTQKDWQGNEVGGVSANEYFKSHPENIIGDAAVGTDRFGNIAMEVTPKAGKDVAKELSKAMNKLPKDIYQPINRSNAPTFDTVKAAKQARTDGKHTNDLEFFERDGKVYQNQYTDSGMVAKEVTGGKTQSRVKGYIKVRDALQSLLIAEMDPHAKETALASLRKQLNNAYDAFVKKNGYLNDKNVRAAFVDDPYSGMVLALEKFDKKGHGKNETIENVEKADIFRKRSVNPIEEATTAENPNDALLISLRNKGAVDLDYMGNLLKDKPESVAAKLSDRIFKDPATESYVTRDEYLSGNVREKLMQAENAAKQDPSYQKNVDELKKVIPKDLIADEISVTLGAPWIPVSDVQAFVDSINDSYGNIHVEFLQSRAKWVVSGYGESSRLKTKGMSLKDMLSDILNNKPIEVKTKDSEGHTHTDQGETDAANVVADDIREEFSHWIWKDKSRRDRLVRYYNDNFNNTILREYDGSHLTFPGMNPTIHMRPHQSNVVWRMLQGGNTLIAHCVGAGKTYEMQAAGMEMRRLGIARKPLYILPNNVVKQFVEDFQKLYPKATLYVIQNESKTHAGFLPSVPKSVILKKIKREDGRTETVEIPFSKLPARDKKSVIEARARRTRTLTQIKTGDYDAIIMSHSQFERLPLSKDTAAQFIQEQLDEVEQAITEAKNGKVDTRTLSSIENQKAKLEDKLEGIMKTDVRDIGIPFEQLGIDQIFVDEADLFKNLHYTTSMDRVNGLPNSNANRSMDMYAKTRWLTNNNGGRGVVFATGTPVSNTMAEMYTMMRYLDFAGLKEKGLQLFDNWIRTFGEIGSGIERKPSGEGFRKVNKVLRFINMPELTKMFRKFADVKTQDDLKLDIPKLKGGKPTIIKIAPDAWLTKYIREKVPKRVAAMKQNAYRNEKGTDNMLSLTNDLRKWSITDSKIDALADEVAKKYEETADVKGAQLIFCDQGIPRAEKETEGKNGGGLEENAEEAADEAESENTPVYNKIIMALEERGIPKDQIAFAQSAKNKDQLDDLFKRVNDGKVRVLIGSTQKMGAGTNCQEHLVALHDLDTPWRPRDLEQRHGRILRQGNKNKEVEIFNYVLQDSFDPVMWEKLKNKAAIVAQAMSGNLQERTVEDADLVTLTYADAENAGTSDPLVKERIKLDSDIKKYKHAQTAFNRKVQEAEETVSEAPKRIEELKNVIEKIKDDISARQDTHGDKFRMTVDGKEYTKREKAKEALGEKLAELNSKVSTKIGEISGFDVKAYLDSDGQPHIQLVRKRAYMANTATVAGIENALRKNPDDLLLRRQDELERAVSDLELAKKSVGQTYPHAKELQQMEARYKEINRQIEANLTNRGGETVEEPVTDDLAKETDNQQDFIKDHVIVTGLPDTKHSASISEERTRAINELKKETLDAFPGAKNIRETEHGLSFEMPNGAKVQLNVVDNIHISAKEEARARREHGFAGNVALTIDGQERTIGEKAFIDLARNGKEGTAYHEALHAAVDMVLSSKEKVALHHAYDKEAREKNMSFDEVVAEHYRDFILKERSGGHVNYGKIFRKVKTFIQRVIDNGKEFFTSVRTARAVFRDIESGAVWRRKVNNSIEKSRSEMGGFSNGETPVRYSAEAEKAPKEFAKKAFLHLSKRSHIKGDKIVKEVENQGNRPRIGFLNYTVSSPSRIAEKVKTFRLFYNMADRAMNLLTKYRSEYNYKLDNALSLVKSKDEKQSLFEILWNGDAEGKEYSRDELKEQGASDSVIEAYTRIRRLMTKAYRMVDDARRRPQTHSKHLTDSEVNGLRENPFAEIHSIGEKNDDGKRLVIYKEYANWEKAYENIDAETLKRFKADDAMWVTNTKQNKDGTFNVKVRESMPHMHRLGGYVPHFFHDYMLKIKDEDGNTLATVGSGRTERDAVKQAEVYLKDHELANGQKIYISPKVMDFSSLGMNESQYAAVMGDKDYDHMVKNIAKNNDLELSEAKELVKGSARVKSRHRFFGNTMQRKGVNGFETDLDWVLRHYFNSASRYSAMETQFKPKAISLYERLYGDFNKDTTDVEARYVKDYINDVNGNPSTLERTVNDFLNHSAVFRKYVVPRFGERASLTLASKMNNLTTSLCLGYFNASSALLNLTQVMNSAAYIGDVSALARCIAKGAHRKYTLHDVKILAETNVLNDIGLDSGSGYDMNRMSAKDILGKLNRAGMWMFKTSEGIVRRGTVLAAYEAARKRGMSHADAIKFAKEVNNKSNFDYGVADAPNLFRFGSIFSQLALQFKKYGIKELEVMADMFPTNSKTSRKQKAIFWGAFFLTAGLMGLPMLDFFDKWPFDDKLKLSVEECMMEAAGDSPAMKALVKIALFGLPSEVLGIDLSNRAGLSDVIPTKASDIGGPAFSKIASLIHDMIQGNGASALRDVSPGLYNQYAAWIAGHSEGKRGRVNDEYNTFYDKMLRAIGFKSTDERVNSDIDRIVRMRRSAQTSREQKAIDDYIDEPTSANRQKLKELGISDKRVETERRKKQQDRRGRTQTGMSKKAKTQNERLMQFGE